MTDTPSQDAQNIPPNANQAPQPPFNPAQDYWGNPPQTPTAQSRYASQAAPQTPYQAQTPPSQGVQNQTQQGSVAQAPAQASAQMPYQQGQTPQSQTQPMPYQQGQANQASSGAYPQNQAQNFGQVPAQNTAQAPASAPGQIQNPPQTPSQNQGLSSGSLALILVLSVGIPFILTMIFVFAFVANTVSPVVDSATSQEQTSAPTVSTEYFNSDLRYRYYLNENDNSSITTSELSKIASYYSGAGQTTDGSYNPGVYYVGKDIPAGSYWLSGEETTTTYYFKLTPDNSSQGSTTYTVAHENSYYGHNIVEVSEGEVLIAESSALALDKMTKKFSAPYQSGVYRVGIDIPAGTYTLSPGSANDYYAYYVMKDLSYTNDSYIDKSYFMNSKEQPTITLEEGTYIELYNLTMKSDSVTI